MAYAGIDIANRTSSVCVLDASGGVEHEITVATEETALVAALGSQSGRRRSSSGGC
ncbi:MAG: hypothetical protein R6V11_08020 [Ectothiorhodospiraceae bacterium]